MNRILSSTDTALARRTEAVNTAIVLEMAQLTPGVEAEAVGGGVAVYAGPESPLTHAVGIGVNGRIGEDEWNRFEAFYRERGVPAAIDLSSLADPSVFEFVQQRPYRLVELAYVMVRPLTEAWGRGAPSCAGVERCDDSATWAGVVARGFYGENTPPAGLMEAFSVQSGRAFRFLARTDGEPAGAAGSWLSGGVAWFAGDATLPTFRGRGVQAALIRVRMMEAARSGCDLAAASVLPGGTSHRNYERAGFEFAYAVIGLRREWDGPQQPPPLR